MYKLTTILCSLMLVGSVSAHDLGNWGQTWPITERDIRQALMENIADIDIEPINQQMKDSVTNFMKNLPKRELNTVDKTRTVTVDLTVALPQDVVLPILNKQTDEYEYKTIYPKGMKINPMKYLDLPQNLVWFNAQDPDEVKFIKELIKKYGNQLHYINVSGNMEDLINEMDMMVFFAKPAELERFKITATPTLMYQLKSKFPEHMLLTTFAKPFTLKEFETYNGAEKAYLNFKQNLETANKAMTKKDEKEKANEKK